MTPIPDEIYALDQLTLDLGLAPETCWRTSFRALYYWETGKGKYGESVQWHPSTNVQQAWGLMLDQLPKRGWHVDYQLWPGGTCVLGYAEGRCYKPFVQHGCRWDGDHPEALALTQLACRCVQGEAAHVGDRP